MCNFFRVEVILAAKRSWRPHWRPECAADSNVIAVDSRVLYRSAAFEQSLVSFGGRRTTADKKGQPGGTQEKPTDLNELPWFDPAGTLNLGRLSQLLCSS